ncbi:MAG: hypothetical protein QNK83_05125 [Akkermansiaceae bacterium]
MKSFLCAALLTLSLAPSYSQEAEPAKPSLEELRKSLASDDFKSRTKATTALWELGDGALDFLAELQNSDDPELAARATTLRKKIRIGILPDTPKELAEALESYFDSDERAKSSFIDELYEDEQFELLVRLRSIEKDEDILKLLDTRIGRIIPQLIRKHLIAGETEKARPFLKLGNDFESLIRYGNFLQVHGELDEAINSLEKTTDLEQQRRYLAYLRVKGDASLLRKEAERLGDENAAATAALVLGDSLPLLKIYADKETSPPEDQLLAKLLLARQEGDQEKSDRFVSALTKLSLERNSSHRTRLNLYRAGLVELARESAEKDGELELIQHYLITDQNQKIPAALGLPDGKVTQEWIDEQLPQVRVELRSGDYSGKTTKFLQECMSFFESRGEIETSTRIFSGFLSVYGEKEKEAVPNFLAIIRDDAPFGGLIALAEKADKTSRKLEKLIQEEFRLVDTLVWLVQKAKKLEPSIRNLYLAHLVHSFTDSPSIPRAEFEKWRVRLEVASLEDLKNGDDTSIRNFYRLQSFNGRASERWRLLKLPSLAEEFVYPHAMLATRLGKWEEAGELYEAENPNLETVYSSFLYQKGLALSKAGKKKDGEELLRLSKLLSDGAPGYSIQLSRQYQEYQENGKSDELLKAAILRSEDAIFGQGVPQENGYYRFPLTYLGESALNSGKWKLASALFEAALLSEDASNTAFALISRFKIEMCKGLIAFDTGRRAEGIKLLEAAHSLLPASGSLADHFFPAIRERGLTEFHDRLCLKTLDLLRQEISAFPNDHSVKNTFAWVASRANRNLDEAEQMMIEALKGDSFSAALLDTMGEVKFAMGKREEAVSWSEKAVDRGILDPSVRGQLHRFRSGPFPVE